MHSHQLPMAEDTPQTTDAPNSATSHTCTTSGKIRRMPSAIRLRPYQQDTAILPIVASATEVAGQPYQNTYMLDAPQTPAPSAEIVATLPLLVKETAVLHALPL